MTQPQTEEERTSWIRTLRVDVTAVVERDGPLAVPDLLAAAARRRPDAPISEIKAAVVSLLNRGILAIDLASVVSVGPDAIL